MKPDNINWEDEFARYDIDLLLKGKKPGTPKPADDEPPLDIPDKYDFTLPSEKKDTAEVKPEPEAESMETKVEEQPVVETSVATPPVKHDDPDVPAPPADPVIPEELKVQMAALEPERQEAVAKAQAQLDGMEPVETTREDMEKMAKKLGEMAGLVEQQAAALAELVEQRRRSLPKGVRSAARRLGHAAEALSAATQLANALVDTDDQKVYDITGKGKLMAAVAAGGTMIAMKTEELPTQTTTLTEALDNGDTDQLLLGRQLFNTAETIENNATDILKGASEAIQKYPDNYGELAIFLRIAAKGDQEAMTTIDHALHRAGEQLICVADAPAMIIAIEENDRDTQTAIIRHMIEDTPTVRSRATA